MASNGLRKKYIRIRYSCFSALLSVASEADADVLFGRTVFFMDEKEEPTGRYLRRVRRKMYAATDGAE
jgi:hypothetical protein